MAGAWTTVTIKDGGGTSRTMRAWDESGTGAGPFSFGQMQADGSGSGVSPAIKAASTAPLASDPALVVAISPNGQLASGLSDFSHAAPVAVSPTSVGTTATPTVTASAYTAGNVLGGIMTFSNILPVVANGTSQFVGMLMSITVKFKGAAVTGEIDVCIFKASPSNGTYTDKSAPTWNAADMANMLGTYALTVPKSVLGTETTYNLDGISKLVQGASSTLYAVAIVQGTPTPASSSDVSVELGVIGG